MTKVPYAYPWDLVGDPAAAERIAGLGADAVALAASYHTTRAATPSHPNHRMVTAARAACYVPIRPSEWRGRLVPPAPTWVDGPDSFGVARESLRSVGLPVHAWTVLTHSTYLGSAHQDLAVRNAFDDVYPYALCPSNEDVAEYCATLVREIVKLGDLDGIILEACGPLGFFHGGHHEKTDGADWDKVQQQLLSLCFCAGCVLRYAKVGVDPVELRASVKSTVDGAVPSSVEEALGADLAARLSEARTAVAADLRSLLVNEIRALAPSIAISLHGNADPWATGPFATVAPEIREDIDTLVVSCWPGPEVSVPGIQAMRELAGQDRGVAGYVLALPPRPADAAALRAEFERYLAAGVDELHVYHAGLASPARLAAIREALTAL
ncbi:hypothetical protein [Allokutzneria oryzae]|uniref:Alanine-rich protein n=1 Tax=Allokutzneria oryzae TaxID=1378989 RepID=A0ABV5ZNY0_9PSEU